jgi:NADH-quinone oxidoreductase subunit N
MGDFSSSLLYLLTYVTTALLLFSVLLSVKLAGRELTYLSDMRLVGKSNYFQIFCLTISLASSAGLPPFAGFYGKLLV